jgi:hypothetical protein
MGKQKKGKGFSEPVQNNGRTKARKQNPRTAPAVSGRGKATGRTVGGYSPDKLRIRAEKREGVVSSK